jgi:hypothetical protein
MYRLFDNATGKLVWEREQTQDESSPIRAWVHDDGVTVIATKNTFGADLLVLNREGVRVFRVDLRDEKSGTKLAESDLAWTSAGPYWYQYAVAYFAAIDGVWHWCSRLFSGRRMAIDLEACAFANLGETSMPDLVEAESAWAREQLQEARFDPHIAPDAVDLPEYESAVKAMLISGLHGLHDQIPKLYEFEPIAWEGGWTSALWLEGHVELAILPIRQTAQRAIRRFGREPRGYSPMRFFKWRDGGQRDEIAVPEFVSARFEKGQSIQAGHTAMEVLQMVGAPDSSSSFECAYDFAEPRPCKLSLEFEGGVVKSASWAQADWTKTDTTDRFLLSF